MSTVCPSIRKTPRALTVKRKLGLVTGENKSGPRPTLSPVQEAACGVLYEAGYCVEDIAEVAAWPRPVKSLHSTLSKQFSDRRDKSKSPRAMSDSRKRRLKALFASESPNLAELVRLDLEINRLGAKPSGGPR